MEKIFKSGNLLKVLFTIVFIIDVIGCWHYYSDPSFGLYTWKHLFASIYLTLKLFTMSITVNEAIVPSLINILRFVSPLLLVSVILNFFNSKTKQYWTYMYVRFFFKDHIIFCGISEKSILLIEDYLKNYKDCRIVIFEDDESKIPNYLIRKRHVKLINNNALDERILEKSQIFKAKTFFALSENENNNICIANEVQELYLKYPSKNENLLNVNIHLSDFYNIRIFKNFQEKKIPNLDFHVFNIYQKAAAFIVDKYSPDIYNPISEADEFVPNILIHGLDICGENVIIESAHLYHFANLKKTHITVVDSDIIHKKQLFYKKYPFIEDIVEIVFYEEVEFFSPLFKLPEKISVCYVCDRNDAESILIARRYRQIFFENNCQNNKVLDGQTDSNSRLLSEPVIVINLSKTPDILNLFGNITSTIQKLNIKIENVFDNVCLRKLLTDDHEVIDDIAKQFHNTYLRLETRELEKSWDRLTDEYKDFNRYPARHIAIKLRYLGAELVDLKSEKPSFDFDKISSQQKLTLARMEHERWVAEKLLTGYIRGRDAFEKDFYKLLKDNLKWHKDIRNWEALNQADKHKDEMLNELKTITSNLKHKKIINRFE